MSRSAGLPGSRCRVHDHVMDAIESAVRRQAERVTPGIDDMAAYLAQQVGDKSHRKATGPVRTGEGASGVIVHRGDTIASWGDPDEAEMCFSATKSVLSTVAGLAYDRGLITDVQAPVTETIDHPAFGTARSKTITWQHLLQQTSGWDGVLWGKPTYADAQSQDGEGPHGAPGSAFAYNDVRVNLLALALTVLWRRPLPDLLATELMGPLGASGTWSWHGYADSLVTVDGRDLRVVSGGAHWGGGLWASANDLARLGELYLRRGRWEGRRLLSAEWIDASWRPGGVNPDYG
jgi:CubicO group peptidase (beta-lactamase class C family)